MDAERSYLLTRSKLSSGGRINQRLTELEQAGFVINFKPYGHAKRGQYYRIIDEYILFYLKWIEPVANSIRHQSKPRGYWDSQCQSASWNSWSGYAFESICYKHIENIRIALNIPVSAEIGTWRYSPQKRSKERGAQIDLLFDRQDGAVTICEIKYSDTLYSIDKDYAENLINKVNVYKKQSRSDKQIFIAVIATSGLKSNSYASELISNDVSLEDLFQESSDKH